LKIILIAIGLIVVFLVVINYLRKLHLDALHFNLLELVDELGGQVLRRGFLARPIYHGKFKGIDLTINFSSERSEKKRREFLDISFAKELQQNLTISTSSWIESKNQGELNDFEPLVIEDDTTYVIRNISRSDYIKKNKSTEFKQLVKNLTPFNYIFCGKSGLLYERECDNLALCTKHPKLVELVESIYKLTRVLN
jgi:hypothetical protein